MSKWIDCPECDAALEVRQFTDGYFVAECYKCQTKWFQWIKEPGVWKREM